MRAKIDPVAVNGLDRKSVKALKKYLTQCPRNFIEIMGCNGGCIAGPAGVVPGSRAARKLSKLLKESKSGIGAQSSLDTDK